MSRPRREHPAALPGNLAPFLLVLILPLLRGAQYITIPDGFPHWLRGIWIDFTVLFGLLFVLAGSWWRRTYDLTHSRLRLRRGFLLHTTTLIPLPLVTTLTVERSPLLRLLGAARVAADTDAGNHRMADVRLLVGRRQARLFLPDSHDGTYYRAANGRLWLLALLSSDSFGGVLLLSTVFRQSGVLVGEGIQQTVLDNLEQAADALVLIPRTAALLALIVLFGWLTGTARHLLRHLPFSVCRRADTLTVYTGRLTQRVHCCAVGAIHYADRRQTLTAYLLRLHSLYISCTGYGKDKNTLAVLVPPCRLTRCYREWRQLLPELHPGRITLRPAKGALMRYLRFPLILLAALPLSGWLIGRQFPQFRELALYLSLMAVLPCLWMLAVRFIDCRTAGLGYRKGQYQLHYSRRLTLHRVTLPETEVAAVHLRRSPRQQRENTCDLLLYSCHEFRHPHRVRHLNLDDVQQLTKFLNIKEV